MPTAVPPSTPFFAALARLLDAFTDAYTQATAAPAEPTLTRQDLTDLESRIVAKITDHIAAANKALDEAIARVSQDLVGKDQNQFTAADLAAVDEMKAKADQLDQHLVALPTGTGTDGGTGGGTGTPAPTGGGTDAGTVAATSDPEGVGTGTGTGTGASGGAPAPDQPAPTDAPAGS